MTTVGRSSELDHPARAILLVGCLLFGGIAVGVAATGLLAPRSEVAVMVGFLMLPVSFGIGMAGWYTAARALSFRMLSLRFLRKVRSMGLYESIHQEISVANRRVFRGTRVFVPVTVCISLLAGMVVAVSTGTGEPGVVMTAYASVGLGYSMLVTWLARHGHLPLPCRAR
jgi:hypothetical protein